MNCGRKKADCGKKMNVAKIWQEKDRLWQAGKLAWLLLLFLYADFCRRWAYPPPLGISAAARNRQLAGHNSQLIHSRFPA
jgi:hypothetical protein